MSHTLTTIGETRAAWQAQDAALGAFGPAERLDPTLVHLDRALCMVTNGDTVEGTEYARKVVLQLSLEYRPTIVLRRARAVTAALPVARQDIPAARALREILAIDTTALEGRPT